MGILWSQEFEINKDFYETKPFDLKVLKSDLSVYIESDEEIIDSIENKIVYLETVIKYIDGSYLNLLQRRGFGIS